MQASGQDVFPLQPAWLQWQSMSGVFSIASHSMLQYLPDVAMHEQTGCAHFWEFAVDISASWPRIQAGDPKRHSKTRGKSVSVRKETLFRFSYFANPGIATAGPVISRRN